MTDHGADGRWRFLDPSNIVERRRQTETNERIDRWWQAFVDKQDDLQKLFAREIEWDLAEWMTEHLGAVDHRIMWEFGPALRSEGHRLVITPEQEVHLRPLVATILERAPSDLAFELHADRPPEPIDAAAMLIEHRAEGSLANASVVVSQGDHHLFDLDFSFPRITAEEDAEFAAYLAATTLLGEARTERWIGRIEAKGNRGPLRVLSQPAPPRESIPLGELRVNVETLIAAAIERLPAAPHAAFSRDATWASLQLEPLPDEIAQHDLFTAITPNVELFRATHARAGFYDERFSSCGETFAYVKLDAEGLEDSAFEDRGAVEDALTEVLERHELGTTIGGGTGRRYQYVELALLDVERGVELVAKALRAGRAPRKSWVLFHRSDWSREWVGVHSDTPPPAM